MPNKLIITDIDDTILNCSDSLEAFYIEKTGHRPIAKLRDTHYMHHAFDIIAGQEFKIVHEFWQHPIFGQLPPEPCAKIVVPRMFKDGYTFAAISSCLDDPLIRYLRNINLDVHYPDVFEPENIHLTYGYSKEVALKLYMAEDAVFVEDNLSNAIVAANLGFTTFLLDRPHNRKLWDKTKANIIRVKDWHHIYRILENET